MGWLNIDPKLPRRIAFLGDYVPRQCGIATFTHDLCESVALINPAIECLVGAVNDRRDGYDYSPRVRFEISEKDLSSYRRAADFLNFNNIEVLSIQHEFGIYGGSAGSHLLALLKEVRMPVVTTLHTILSEPNKKQKLVMNEIIKYSDRLVVMAQKGVELLKDIYHVTEEKIDLIPHGIPDLPFIESSFYKEPFGVSGRMVLFTFGLLGPSKGIEYVINALPEIVAKHPEVVYLILGATHPTLLANDGESYRLSLERLAKDLGVTDHIIFYNRYVSLDDLKEFIGAADIYITPYLNEAQITSGTLAYVFGAGKAVISTPYWYAQEMLANQLGVLVPFRNAAAIASAVVQYLDDSLLLQKTRKNAYNIGREMIWSAVAKQYMHTFQQACTDRRTKPRRVFAEWTLSSRSYELPPLKLDHLERMTDRTGIFQHAIFNVPNYKEGYCTDDNARAFILCNLLDEHSASVENLDDLATIYLAFIYDALAETGGRFRNFMSYQRLWLEDFGSEDSHARALWAAGTGVGRSKNEGHRNLCGILLQKAMAETKNFQSPRAWAFTLLAIHEYMGRFDGDSQMNSYRLLFTERLISLWRHSSSNDWPWFEPVVSYDNARICQALIISGRVGADSEALKIGLESLRWLASQTLAINGPFRPIGSNGFFHKNGERAFFDQQPIEASAMVSACLEAFQVTADPIWSHWARRSFEWFLGRNDLGLPLYDPHSGGCRDGLHRDRTNANQGAESTLAFHLALAEMRTFDSLLIPEGILR